MSDRPRLTFERVEIRRMPGIDAGFAVDGLCPGINVICGPNASGKTSLTRAVSTLLWPRTGVSSRSVLLGTFALDGRSWRVGYDTGSTYCQCDGQDADFPSLDSADDRDRYLLALHDLLRADNRDFAEAILRESTGGYDISQAASDLGYTAKPSTQTVLRQRLDQARTREREARLAQESFRQQERRLEELEAERLGARDAGQTALAIQRALDYQRSVVVRDDAIRAFGVFPPILATLSGQELDELLRLRERVADAVVLVEQERAAVGRAQERLAATGLPTELQPGTIARLRSLSTALQDHAIEIRGASERRISAEAQVASARLAIGPDVDDERLAALGPIQLNALAGLMNQSREAHAVLDGLTSIAAWIPPSPGPGPDRDDQLSRMTMGVQYLNHWLRQGQPRSTRDALAEPRQSAALLVAAGFAIVEALMLGVLAHPVFFVLLPVVIVLLVAGVRRRTTLLPAQAPEPHATDWRGEYEQLGLQVPEQWEPDAVLALVDNLSRQLRTARAEHETRQRWQYVHDERPAAVAQVTAVDERVAAVSRHFGIPAVTDVAALHTLSNAINTWQLERNRADSAVALHIDALARHDATLRPINDVLANFGYPAASGLPDATSAIDDLASREQARGEALLEAIRGTRRIDEQLQPQFARCQDELVAFFERFGLEHDDEHGLRTLLDRVPDYQAATLAVDRATLELDRAHASLEDAAPLIGRGHDDLEADLDAARAASATLESISYEIAAIEARIEQAKRGHDLEAALEAEHAAIDDLREARSVSEALVAGWSLAGYVQERTRDIDRPRVFHRARELFARITQGRYELNVDGADPPRFRAQDTITGAGHALDELSSGTRLQLLLAVRVAFVEQQERGPMLPLILDETLGNSDEHRARAIIDATVQIARDGRQVLYLTAQHDEVRKWQSIMAERPDVPFALVDLAQVRGLADWERLPPASPQPWPLPVVPEPNGHNREQYGQLLHVPGIDLAAADPGGLHLWHLIDEPSSLHALLSLQIETWGQLRALAEYGGVGLLDDATDVIERCRARALTIGTIAECWRIGRGRPVDRIVLRDSEAVTEVFIDRVSQLAESLDGDAVALLRALEDGRVTWFRASACMTLKEYLEEHGYIDLTPPLSPNDVRARVLANSAPDLAAGLVTPDWVNTMLATLWCDGGTTG